MVDFVVESLRPLCTNILFSLPVQTEIDLRVSGYPVIFDKLPDLGPLSGVESALRSGIARTYLFVCCDQPRVTTEMLARLLVVGSDTSAAFFESTDRFVVPFPSLIRSELAPLAKDLLATRDRSIRRFARSCQPALAAIEPFEQGLISSVNTPDELVLFEAEQNAKSSAPTGDGINGNIIPWAD